MNIKRTWVVVGAIAVAGFAGAGVALAGEDADVHDQKSVPAVELTDSADSDSPAGATDSATSATSANSANSANSPADADSANSPADADSANSPN